MTKRKIKKTEEKIRCPVCGTTDFDVEDGIEKPTEGFCVAGCGTYFKINEEGSTKEIGYIERG